MTRRRVYNLAVLALGGALAAWPLPLPAAEDARQILIRSLEPRVTAYVGEQVSITRQGVRAASRAQRQDVFRKGNVLRVNYANGQVLFDDGKVQLFYLPRLQVVEKRPSALDPRRIAVQRKSLSRRGVQVTSLPDETVAGRAAYGVSVRTGGIERRIWIDQEHYLQLRQDVVQSNGRTVSTYFTHLELHREPPAAMLAFTPAPGVTVVDEGAGRPLAEPAASRLASRWGGLLEPRSVPAGYRLRGHYQRTVKGLQVLVSVYDGPGRKTLSLFQGPAMGMSGMRESRPNLRVLTGSKGRADVMLVGALSEEELQRVMDSLAPH